MSERNRERERDRAGKERERAFFSMRNCWYTLSFIIINAAMRCRTQNKRMSSILYGYAYVAVGVLEYLANTRRLDDVKHKSTYVQTNGGNVHLD